MKHTQTKGHGLMCIFDELGILLCTHTAEDCVFANRLSEQVALISFYSISLFSAKYCLVRLVRNIPHLVDARGLFVFVSSHPL